MDDLDRVFRRISVNSQSSGASGELYPDRTDTDDDSGLPRKKSTVAWLGLGIAAIAFIALSVRLVSPLKRQSLVILQGTNVIFISANILSDLENAEAQEHGYLLTGQPSYLEAFSKSRRVLDEEFDRLWQLAKNNSKEQQQIEKLRDLVHRELNELRAIMDTRATAGFGPRVFWLLPAAARNEWIPFAKTSAEWLRWSRARWQDSRGKSSRE